MFCHAYIHDAFDSLAFRMFDGDMSGAAVLACAVWGIQIKNKPFVAEYHEQHTVCTSYCV